MELNKMTETELKILLDTFLVDDFHFVKEVKGEHIVEKTTVIVDYFLRPKSHLVNRRFDDTYFAIEVKSPKNSNPHAQYRKALVQAASYSDSFFSGKRPTFTLIFPAYKYFMPLSLDDTRHANEVTAYFTIAQYFNVGDFRIGEEKDKWCVWFSGGRYFCSNRGKGQHNLTKRYVGNIS